MEPFSYQWILILGIIFAIADAFGIGANDVANSFATSVGSRSLTLKAAICIAIFTEFGGAVLLGAETTETVKNKIVDPKLFAQVPEVLMLGFMCALVGSSIFVNLASVIGWPVSTTHSIVGAVGGIGFAAFGPSAVQWTPLSQIFISWVAAPGLSGVIAAIIFLITKYSILNSKDSLRRGIVAIPIYFMIALGITTFYVLSKAPKLGWDLAKNPEKAGVNLGTTAGCTVFYGIVCYVFLVPYFKRYLVEEEDLKWYHVFMPWTPTQPKNTNLAKHLAMQAGEIEKNDSVMTIQERKDMEIAAAPAVPEDDSIKSKLIAAKDKAVFVLTRGIKADVASIQGAHQQSVHDAAIRYENKTEYLFSFLQVCTAAFASFAHGSNDVANAAGPLSAIVTIYNTGKIPDAKVGVAIWILAVMGVSIDLGLIILGYRIMAVLGNNITYHSPSRGFSMEFGAALAVVTASFLGIPVSTTHCITGATVGVGLCNGNLKAINWRMVAWIIFGWILTLPFVGILSGALFKLLLSTPKF
jgi:phosphate/sulfate permease